MRLFWIYTGLIIAGATLGLLIGEIILQFFYPKNSTYYPFPPYFSFSTAVNPEYIKGIYGSNTFAVNKNGLRGDSEKGVKQILILGGSAAECFYLDQEESLGEQIENEWEIPGAKVNVVSAARSGMNTVHIAYQLEKLLKQGQRYDLIIVLTGLNDALVSLSEARYTYLSISEEELSRKSFSVHPFDSLGAKGIQSTGIYNTLSKTYRRFFEKVPELLDDEGAFNVWQAEKRKKALAVIDTLPDIQYQLARFTSQIDLLSEQAKAYGARLVFVGQPSAWGTSEDSLQRSFWMGRYSRDGESMSAYYTISVMEKTLLLFNRELQLASIRNQNEFIPLHVLIPPSGMYFYDDCHFTEKGASYAAEQIAKRIIL